MKKGGIKRLLFLALASLIVSSHAIVPVVAMNVPSGYIRVATKDYSEQVGSLDFHDVNFHDFSGTSLLAFGLSGKITNNSFDEIRMTSIVNYYSYSQNLLASSTNTQVISGSQTVAFTQMSNIDILNRGVSVENIYYYTINVTTDENEEAYVPPAEDTTTPSKTGAYNGRDYVIDAYDVDIVVNDDNTYDITETIQTYFNASYKHGIIRSLPLKANLKRLDGSSNSTRIKVKNLSVDEEYTTSREDGNLNVKIGSASRYVKGEKTYTIKYTYDFGPDTLADSDEFYFNIIGTQWDTVIGNITFNIHMPKEFDASKVGFSYGEVGSTKSDSILFTITGNDISGSFNGILGVYEGLTVRMELDEGYFENAHSLTENWEYLAYGIPIIGLMICAILWLIFGRDDHSVETIEFYPPEGMNSLDVALVTKGRVDSKDVISLLFVLANKGYIKIEEEEKKHSLGARSYKFYRLKEYDGNDPNEKTFMDGMFKKRHSVYSTASMREVMNAITQGEEVTSEMIDKAHNETAELDEYVTSKSLENKFYRTINTITTRVNKKTNRSKYFENTTWQHVIAVIALIIGALSPFVVYGLANGDIEATMVVVVMLLFYSPFFLIGIFAKMPVVFRIFWLSFTCFHFTLMMAGSLSDVSIIAGDAFYTGAFIVMALCVVGMAVFIKLMPRRTALGVELYGKIKGLKTFMKTADSEHIKQMLASDKNYAYMLLPYAYVLGISTKWMRRFEALNTQMSEPDWYVSGRPFSINNLSGSMNSMMSSVSSSLSSSPSSSGSGGGSGGGSSGGGSSGGGGGGGGGSSW